MQILLSILGFLLFIGLVLIHEWGHYKAARRGGVEVEEFGLGLPPRAWGKKLRSGMLLSLNWLPLGGFVKLKGEFNADRRPGSFGAASLSAKVQIMLAGVTMNFIAGLLLLTLLALIGLPRLITPAVVGEEQFTIASDTKITHQEVRAGVVVPGSPAAQIGLKTRDKILNINSGEEIRNIKTAEQLRSTTQSLAGQEVEITYARQNQVFQKNVKLLTKTEIEASRKSNSPKGYLGVTPVELQIQRSTWSAPIVAVGLTKQIITLTVKGIGSALAGLGSIIAGGLTGNQEAREQGHTQATEQVGGPVAIGAVLWGSGNLGINFILTLIALLSLTLAIINILPIPALDGGQLVITLVSSALKKPISRKTEELIRGTSMAFLLILFVLITIVDVRRFL